MIMQFTLKFRAGIIINAYKDCILKSFKVLSVGCGNGIVDKEIANHFRCKVHGTDVLKYNKTDIPFKKMVEEDQLPYKDKEFDIVMFNDVLHHATFEVQEKLLLEARRVSKKILIFEAKPNLKTFIMEKLMNQIHNKNMNVPNTHRISDEWIRLFKKHDFKYSFELINTPFFYPLTHYKFVLS